MKTKGNDRISLFASLPDSEIVRLLASMKRVSVPEGTLIIQEGHPGDRFYLVIDGQLEVIKALGTQDERFLGNLEPGDGFGEMSLFDPAGLRVASVRARTAANLYEMAHADFHELIHRWPSVAYKIACTLSRRLCTAHNNTIRDLQEKNRLLAQAQEELKKYRDHLEGLVKERTAELETATKELEAFSYSVSHDLKAPVHAIEGFSRILMHKYSATLESEPLRMLNIIYSNTRRMSQMIDDLLTFSRTSRKKVRKAEINLYAMTNKAFEQLRHQTPERDIQLNIGELPPALGDPSLIEQVMVNLLANAIKFTSSRKTAVIEVGGRTEGKETIYYVKDNGAGFNEQIAHKLYEVFQRLHSYDEYEGSGVGLAIVKSIIQRHSGRVWAEGKVDQGATFYFALPKNGA